MTKAVKAGFAKGLLTPLEPLALAEDSVALLDMKELPADEPAPDKPKFHVVPNDSEFLIDMEDPRALKELLDDEDLEHYLRSVGRGK